MAGKPDKDHYIDVKNHIEILKTLQNKNQIDISYFDESGFSLKSNVPYAWQEKGKEIIVTSSRSKNLTVSGFLSNVGNKLASYITKGSVTSETVVAMFDDFASKIKKKTFVILDNASIHTSRLFESNIKKWNNKNLYLIYLPPYSPQLNHIEILWRFIKYQWLGISAFLSLENLENKLDTILANFGTGEYTINFA